jgi:hypothetical protein
MQSTHVQTVEIIAGVEPLRLRYSMLNQRFLTKVLSSVSHPLKQKLSELQLILNINPRRSIYNYHLDALLHTPVVDAEVREALKDIQRDCDQIVAPRLVSSITSRFPPDSVLYTTSFGVDHSEKFELGLRLVEPSGVFTSELTAILYALILKTHSPGRYIILTDSLSSVYALESRIIAPKVHELVYQYKEAFWQLNGIGYMLVSA